MAVNQHRRAEIAVDAGEQAAQRPVIGLVEALDPAKRVVDRNALAVDFLGVADHAGDRAEPARDPHRAGVGEGRQPAVEHARVELIGLAVDVDIAAREMRPHHRVAAAQHARGRARRRTNPPTGAASPRRAVRWRGIPADRRCRECGELKTTGPRHVAGSRISKGGSSSSLVTRMESVCASMRWKARNAPTFRSFTTMP